MNRSTLVVLSAAAFAVASCGTKTTTNETATTTDTTTTNSVVSETIPPDTMNAAGMDSMNAATAVPATGQAFANTVAASDAFEIASSKLATTDAQSAPIKSFAKQMITAHTESTAKLKKLASGKPGITPDPTLNGEQQQKLDALRILKGTEFDHAYVADQIAAHQQALDALNGYASSGDDPDFKAFGVALVPTVTAHLNMAKGLKP
jgi:putative membrane protein